VSSLDLLAGYATQDNLQLLGEDAEFDKRNHMAYHEQFELHIKGR